METIIDYFEICMIGLASGLIGVFYRNCLKLKGMIFNYFYKLLSRWVKVKKGILRFIAYPLGFCVYCSTIWITIFMYIITKGLNLHILLSIGVSHAIVLFYCKNYFNKKDFKGVDYKFDDYNLKNNVLENIPYMTEEQFDRFMLGLKE